MSIPANSHIVFQAYGNVGILQECALAMLSLCQRHTREDLAGTAVWIYTDNPDFFNSFKDCWLNLKFRQLDAAKLAEWRGSIDFVHRVKVAMLQDFVKDKDGQVLYLDTDVYFIGAATGVFQNIADGKLYMHTKEGPVHGSDNVVFRKLSQFIKSRGNELPTGSSSIHIPEGTTMWNAGVLGFPSRHDRLLNSVLEFTDSVYEEYPKHIVEQYAFSIFFSNEGSIFPADTVIFHYWNLKELRAVLQSFFEHFSDSSWDELVKYSKMINPMALVQQKQSFQQKRSLIDKLVKRKWAPPLLAWDLLVQKL
jgi:hypothetical protein